MIFLGTAIADECKRYLKIGIINLHKSLYIDTGVTQRQY